MKKCYKCGLLKPVNEFSKDRSRSSGIGSRCRKCDKEKMERKIASDPKWYKRVLLKQADRTIKHLQEKYKNNL